jgi:hypothetical protein
MSGWRTAACAARSGKSAVANNRLRRAGRLLCMLGILAVPAAWAQFIVDAVPGGLVEIPLADRDEPRPEAYFGQRRILVTQFGRRWAGLIGLPRDMVPGRYVIQIAAEESENIEIRDFTVYPGRRDERPPVSLSGPPPGADAAELAWRDTLDAELPLNTPVPLPAQRTFGRYRETSQPDRQFVDFVVFTIPGDMTVRAPGSGRIAASLVLETDTYVWIDHGMGLFTRLGPLTRAALDTTAPVQAGEPVGIVRLDDDETPRPLFLSVFLNGAAINPFLIADIEASPVSTGDETP